MQNFIAQACGLACELMEIGVNINDEYIILVLTGGLPHSYDHFVITLDSTHTSELTLDYVVTRLLNEEAHQLVNTPTKWNTPCDPGVAALATSSSKKPGSHTSYCPACNLANITCF